MKDAYDLGRLEFDRKDSRVKSQWQKLVRAIPEADPKGNINNSNGNSYRLANVFTCNRRNLLPNNNITLMLGGEPVYSKSDRLQSSAKMFPKYIDPEGALSMMTLGVADPIISVNSPANRTSPFFGRLNYDCRERYLLSLVMRADGLSKFARGNRWGYFPSASTAWRISDENFMKPTSGLISYTDISHILYQLFWRRQGAVF